MQVAERVVRVDAVEEIVVAVGLQQHAQAVESQCVAIVELLVVVVVFDVLAERSVALDAVEVEVVVFVGVRELRQVHRIVVHVGREDMVFLSNTFWAALAWQELVLRSR